MICDAKRKAGVLNDFFLGRSDSDDSHVPGPDDTCNVERTLVDIVLTQGDIEDLLKSLDISKDIYWP